MKTIKVLNTYENFSNKNSKNLNNNDNNNKSNNNEKKNNNNNNNKQPCIKYARIQVFR